MKASQPQSFLKTLMSKKGVSVVVEDNARSHNTERAERACRRSSMDSSASSGCRWDLDDVEQLPMIPKRARAGEPRCPTRRESMDAERQESEEMSSEEF